MRIHKILLMLFITTTILSCNCQQKTDKQTAIVEIISVEKLEQTDSTIQLIDVRTPEEYAEGFIKEAKNIDFFNENFMESMATLNKEEAVYIYCKSGGRSGKASAMLKEAGFTKVYDLGGGILDWEKEGKAISHTK